VAVAHRQVLEAVDYIRTPQDLLLRHQQNLEPPSDPETLNGGGGSGPETQKDGWSRVDQAEDSYFQEEDGAVGKGVEESAVGAVGADADVMAEADGPDAPATPEDGSTDMEEAEAGAEEQEDLEAEVIADPGEADLDLPPPSLAALRTYGEQDSEEEDEAGFLLARPVKQRAISLSLPKNLLLAGATQEQVGGGGRTTKRSPPTTATAAPSSSAKRKG
jgi:hypothetical protein